ncbi:MAG: hypothetical protein SFX18_12205 [Pirellulales bacterium]|nr:hypothetical protein [Pirellulales bacterium]
MPLHVEIPEPLAAQVADAAKSRGASPEEFILQAVADSVDPLARLRKLALPITERLQELGETEDDAVEFFEQIKHDLRRQRRTA